MFKKLSQSLSNKCVVFKTNFYFSAPGVKKQKMELTLRTPYETIFKNFDGFSRIITKTNESALVLQNKAPPAIYILPPGPLKIKLNAEVKGTSGDFLHMGGWVCVHTCEINLLDVFEKKDVKADLFDKAEIPKERDDMAGRYAGKLRKTAARIFLKKATV